MFSQVYIVYEKDLSTNIPIPMGKLGVSDDFDTGFSTKPDDFLKPRFDPFMPMPSPTPSFPKMPLLPTHSSHPNHKILCVCKDLETANQFLDQGVHFGPYGKRYISGPHNVL
jgi:hypothetical protein